MCIRIEYDTFLTKTNVLVCDTRRLSARNRVRETRIAFLSAFKHDLRIYRDIISRKFFSLESYVYITRI